MLRSIGSISLFITGSPCSSLCNLIEGHSRIVAEACCATTLSALKNGKEAHTGYTVPFARVAQNILALQQYSTVQSHTPGRDASLNTTQRSSTLPTRRDSEGLLESMENKVELPFAGAKVPDMPIIESPASTLLGRKGVALLRDLKARAEIGNIGAAVSSVLQELPQREFGESTWDESPETSLGERFDESLERWSELLEDGDYQSVIEQMRRELGLLPGKSPFLEAPVLREEDPGKADRREREERIKEEFRLQRVRLVDELGRAYATGKRKTSIARVWIREPPMEREGLGRIKVNGRHFDDYFASFLSRIEILKPFDITGTVGLFDVRASVQGGGFTGQAEALRHGISKALQCWDPAHRSVLKDFGLLTRDARVVERKKPGKAKARKSFQWVKR